MYARSMAGVTAVGAAAPFDARVSREAREIAMVGLARRAGRALLHREKIVEPLEQEVASDVVDSRVTTSTGTTVATAMHATPSPRPIHPIPSFVLPFTLTDARVEAERGRERIAHCLAIRRDARQLRDHRDVDVARPPSPIAQMRHREREHLDRVAASVRRIGVRKHRADVALARRAEQRIGDGVRDGVGIRVADERMVVRNADAAEANGVRRDRIGASRSRRPFASRLSRLACEVCGGARRPPVDRSL